MHKVLNLFSFPLLLSGLVFLSHGLLGYNYSKTKIKTFEKTSSQINNLYSEKEILLKDTPVSEILSDKLIVRIRLKPINPKITSAIKNKGDIYTISNLLDKDFNYLSPSKREFVKTVLPIIINENQNILTTRSFIIELKNKLKTYKTLSNDEVYKLNSIAKKFNINYSKKHKLDLINELLSNVDIIPNSIALAQAAIESGWGKSRFAKENNDLFGEHTYDQNQGVVPL